MSKDINYTFKMLYVIAIFMIVDGHIGYYNYLQVTNALHYQNYHVALFAFTSGYFLNLERNYKDFFSIKLTKLILPLYLWNLFYGILCWYLNHYQGFALGSELNAYNLLIAPITDGHQFIYNMGAWFLIPLFFIQTISYILLQPIAKQKAALQKISTLFYFVFCLILGAVAVKYGPQNGGTRNFTLAILRTFYLLPSFAFGFLYRKILEKYDRINTPLYLCALLTIITALCHYYPQYNHLPSWLNYINVPFWVVYTLCFCSILFWLRVSKVFSPVIEKSRSLQYVANHTFDIMMHHFIGFMFIKAALQKCANFNLKAYKTDIWYYYFPINEDLIEWLYIIIAIVVALLVGYINHLIYTKIKQKLNFKGENNR